MNRRQFLSSGASLGVSAALPASPKPIGPPRLTDIEVIPFNLSLGAVNYVPEFRFFLPRTSWRTLNAGQPLDSCREPWQACDAGDVPVQE